jgi:aminopeptidase N
MIKFPTILLLISFLISCSSPKKLDNSQSEIIKKDNIDIEYDSTNFDEFSQTEEIEPERPFSLSQYNESPRRKWDLLHTRIQISFDWEKERALASVQLKLTPYIYPDSILVLDAKNFDIHQIRQIGSNSPLIYHYDSIQLFINLGKMLKTNDTLSIQIDYTAKPAERLVQLNTEGAVTSDQGLFFINPRGITKGKPQQIWTQGETSYNSCWFPTIDQPNERCTGELLIQVEDRFVTLSNGLLKSSVKQTDGTRIDHWVMDQPHAPYLFMMAIGEYTIVKDRWRNLELAYYVEPKYAPHARDIFAHTPEMLDFFSKKFGLDYPWQKYHQVIVRDYVSGAMENTTAVIFGDFVQRTKRQLLEEGNDKIVAHELAHHWFGNYVTCESWANLTMNEGFANYSEYLWLEHKYGKDEADLHRAQELSAYIENTMEGQTKNLIRFDYGTEEEMFDVHSYNKGGLVLHMLRYHLGDEVFYKGVKTFLHQNAYKAVEAHHLRLAMEEVSGMDLNWFFNQWFFDKGHPELTINHLFDAQHKKTQIFISQTQSTLHHRPLFNIQTYVELYFANGRKERHPIRFNSAVEVFDFDTPEKPIGILIDPDYVLLAKISYDFDSDPAYLRQRFNADISSFYKIESLNFLEEGEDAIFITALDHPFWMIRGVAVEKIFHPMQREKLWQMALEDPHPYVRNQALNILVSLGLIEPQDESKAKRIIEKGVTETGENTALAISTLHTLNPDYVMDYIQHHFENEEDPFVILTMIGIGSESGDSLDLMQVVEKVKFFEGYDAFSYMSFMYLLHETTESRVYKKSIERMSDYMAYEDSRPIQRYAFMSLLGNLKAEQVGLLKEGGVDGLMQNQEELEWILRQFEKVKSNETNPQLKAIYDYINQE